MSEQLRHISLSNGQERLTSRSDVADFIIAQVGAFIRDVSAGQRVAVIPGPGISLTGYSSGAQLLMMVWEEPPGGKLATIAVSSRSDGADAFWEGLYLGRSGLRTRADSPPESPWCATIIEPGIDTQPGIMWWLDDFERAIAWAWLEAPQEAIPSVN